MNSYIKDYEDGDFIIRKNGFPITLDECARSLNEAENAHAAISALAQSLIGYEPVTYAALIDKAMELKEISINYQHNKQASSLFEAIRDLNAMADDIESDA